MPVNKYNIYIICKDESTFRDKATLLTKQFSSKLCHVQWVPAEYLTLTQCNRKLLKKLKTLYNTKKKKIIAKLGCIAAHRKALLAIYSNQTHNNLILEEDAELSSRLPYPPKHSCYMGGWIIPPKISRAGKQAVHVKPKSGLNSIDYQRFKIITTHALFIKSPEQAANLLDQTIEPEQLKPYDIFLADHQIFTRFYYPPVFIQGSHKSEIDGKGVDINRKRTINYGLQSTTRHKKVTKRKVGKRRLTQRRLTQRRRVKRRLTKRGGKPIGRAFGQVITNVFRRGTRVPRINLDAMRRNCAITNLLAEDVTLYTKDTSDENQNVCRQLSPVEDASANLEKAYYLDSGCLVDCNTKNHIYSLLVRIPVGGEVEDPLDGRFFIYVGKASNIGDRLQQHVSGNGGSLSTRGNDILAMKVHGVCPGVVSGQHEKELADYYEFKFKGCVRWDESPYKFTDYGLSEKQIVEYMQDIQDTQDTYSLPEYPTYRGERYTKLHINVDFFDTFVPTYSQDFNYSRFPQEFFGPSDVNGTVYYRVTEAREIILVKRK